MATVIVIHLLKHPKAAVCRKAVRVALGPTYPSRMCGVDERRRPGGLGGIAPHLWKINLFFLYFRILLTVVKIEKIK